MFCAAIVAVHGIRHCIMENAGKLCELVVAKESVREGCQLLPKARLRQPDPAVNLRKQLDAAVPGYPHRQEIESLLSAVGKVNAAPMQHFLGRLKMRTAQVGLILELGAIRYRLLPLSFPIRRFEAHTPCNRLLPTSI